ncbi:hemopexin repeat-containing protein [Taklimakanibacter deserti]|uniref:hemopexin repeat-containing protein n=1 Tax=Taklimakanibacter deserti TaxID=2267839 RepID=UPI000E65C1DF
MREHFRQSISMERAYRRGEPIILKYELVNESDDDYALLSWETPFEHGVGNFIEVRFGDRVVPYDGRLVKRGEPTEVAYRRITPRQRIAEELDLSTAFAFDEPGIYTVTLHVRFRDAIRQADSRFTARRRIEHEGFALEPLSWSFELLPDGEARLTDGQKARRRQGARPRRDASDFTRDLSASELTIDQDVMHKLGGLTFDLNIPPVHWDVFDADQNAVAWVDSTLAELASWNSRTDNALYTEWFGADNAARYQTIRDHYSAIRARLVTPHTYDLTPDDCSPGDFAYTYAGSDTVYLCGGWFNAPKTGIDSKFGTFVHEWSHAVAGTGDTAYGQAAARNLALTNPAGAINNADNHEYMVETLADRMLTAPVVWPNNGKAYFFVAGKYYRYDIANDRVDEGYPKPIAGNWPGLWTDRVDSGIVWPNGKAYFFKDNMYMRYDIATDRVDDGYPKPIAGNWPGLWGDRIDAAIVWPTNGKAYFFRDGQYMRYDIAADRVDPGYPLPIAGNWPGLWGDAINGAIVWPNGKAYFFRGWQYMRYDIAADRVDGGYPKAIAENWPFLWWGKVDASVFWPNGKAYFFQGSRYMRYDNPSDRVDPGYPLPISGNWRGLWTDRIDAGIVWPNGKAYFFRDSEYMRFDIATDKVDPGYPQSTAANWPGLGSGKIDAAVIWPNGKAYFFRGSTYLRYDIAADRVDDGYPLPIAGNWPGLWSDRVDSAIVWPNGKVYFFRDSQYMRYDIATDRVDPGYPCPIGWNWFYLPGRVR